MSPSLLSVGCRPLRWIGLRGSSAALPVCTCDGRGETGCRVFPSYVFRFCCCPLAPPRPHRPTCPIIRGRLYRRRALPREGSGVTSTRRHKGECGRGLMHRQTERSDGPMMYLQTVAEEVGHSGITEAGRQEDRKRRAVRHLPEMMRKPPVPLVLVLVGKQRPQ